MTSSEVMVIVELFLPVGSNGKDLMWTNIANEVTQSNQFRAAEITICTTIHEVLHDCSGLLVKL